MKKRVSVLHKKLKVFVDRKDITVLETFLPPKHEFVVSIKMTDFQTFLYSTFLMQLHEMTESGSI